jgi:hypothetical protein
MDESPLVALQHQFARLVVRLLTEAFAQGYEVSLDECYRPHAVAELYAHCGVGIEHSLHTLRLAADLNIWQHGALLPSAEAYTPLGTLWKSYDPLCRWGGDFHTKDARHFSLAYGGRA